MDSAIYPEYSLQGLMLKLKLQSFGHLMWKSASLEMILMLGMVEGRSRGGRGEDEMASLTQRTSGGANSGRQWRTGKAGVHGPWGYRTAGHNLVTELQQQQTVRWPQSSIQCPVLPVECIYRQILFHFILFQRCYVFYKLKFHDYPALSRSTSTIFHHILVTSCLSVTFGSSQDTAHFFIIIIFVTMLCGQGSLLLLLQKYWGLPRWPSWKRIHLPRRRCKWCGFLPWVEKIPWRQPRPPTPVFLPGESHGQRSLVDCSPWGCKESDMTESDVARSMHTQRLRWQQFLAIKSFLIIKFIYF